MPVECTSLVVLALGIYKSVEHTPVVVVTVNFTMYVNYYKQLLQTTVTTIDNNY